MPFSIPTGSFASSVMAAGQQAASAGQAPPMQSMGDEERINKVYFVQIEAMKRAGANDSAIIAWLLSQGVMGTEKARLVMNRYEREFASVDPVTKFFKSVPLWGWGVGLGVVGILLAGTAYRRSANPPRRKRRGRGSNPDFELVDDSNTCQCGSKSISSIHPETGRPVCAACADYSKHDDTDWDAI